MRVGRLVSVMVASVMLVGCSYLTGYNDLGEDFDPATPDATYTSGSATLTIEGVAMSLDRLASTGTYYDGFGADAIWTDGEGRYVRLSAASTTTGFLGPAGYLTLDRIADTAHWTTLDSTRCLVTVDRANVGGLAGSASCRGLRWSDALNGYGLGYEPSYIEGQLPFDAEIRFAAPP